MQRPLSGRHGTEGIRKTCGVREPRRRSAAADGRGVRARKRGPPASAPRVYNTVKRSYTVVKPNEAYASRLLSPRGRAHRGLAGETFTGLKAAGRLKEKKTRDTEPARPGVVRR